MVVFGIVALCLTFRCNAVLPSGRYVGQARSPYLKVDCAFYRTPKPFVTITVTCNPTIPESPMTSVDILQVPTRPKEFCVKRNPENIGKMKNFTDRLNGMCPGRGFNSGDFVSYIEVDSGLEYDVKVKNSKVRLYLEA
ncbi:hypothetical protein FOL47_007032 [Perkinsus chesapeaki]|uniref:Uncharacterized protein n=1 Tax=Perkinsus chesapeaki TaxID=330153 RepID=A0A7J6LND7_PERCH|nr:hypothetical protein FOL47_007032 [Perkinsus chesapeaki]